MSTTRRSAPSPSTNWSRPTTEQTRGLLDGGVDVLLLETVFDSLNSKAALFAIDKYFEETGRRVPVMVSFTITDLSGRTLSGQTVEAYWNSISHHQLLSVGINCALGPKEMRPFIEELAGIADIYVSAYPNAGSAQPDAADRLPGDARDARAAAPGMGARTAG